MQGGKIMSRVYTTYDLEKYPKVEDIKTYIFECIDDYDDCYDVDELHDALFNVDYYLEGNDECIDFLGDEWWEIQQCTIVYMVDELGYDERSLYRIISDVEKLVNMYTYLVGGELLRHYFTPHTDKYDTTRENDE